MTTIINIKSEHILECSKLFLKTFNAQPWNDKWTPDTAFKRLHDIFLSPNFEGISYFEDGEIKGAVFGYKEQYYDGVHYNLKELFISTDLQGKSVGSKLIQELEKRLLGLGVTNILLFTLKGTRASNFYLKNNFSECNNMTIMSKDM